MKRNLIYYQCDYDSFNETSKENINRFLLFFFLYEEDAARERRTRKDVNEFLLIFVRLSVFLLSCMILK